MVVLPHPPPVVVQDVLDVTDPVLDLEHLVHLLLIFGDDEPGAAMFQHIGHLFRHRVLVKRHRDRAHRLSRDHGPVERWTVPADDRDMVAFGHPKLEKAKRQRPDFLLRLDPGPALPDPVFLFPISCARAPFQRISRQQRRYGDKAVVRPPGWIQTYLPMLARSDLLRLFSDARLAGSCNDAALWSTVCVTGY